MRKGIGQAAAGSALASARREHSSERGAARAKPGETRTRAGLGTARLNAARLKFTQTARIAAAAALAATCASAALAAPPASARSRALDSRVLKVKDSARLHLVHADGNTLVEQGHATGTLPGNVRVTLTLHSHKATSTFTLYVKGGTISGRGAGSLKTGRSGWDSFGGSLSVRRGSGHFQHVHGSGGLYGSVYRVDDSMNAQVYGTLHY